MFSELGTALRFLAALPTFLRSPFSLTEARTILDARRAGRSAAFLAIARRAIYGRSASPYRALLDLAGCEYGDLERLVAAEGVEGALRSLFANGVYVSSDELKGRQPVRRGSAELTVDPRDFLNRGAVVVLSETSGSRGPRAAVPIDLAFIRDHAVDTHLTLEAHDGTTWTHAHWGVPGGTAVTNLLEFAKGGTAPARWFSPVQPSAPGLHPRYRWGARALRWGSVVAGVPLPRPMHVPLDDPLPIARWMANVLASGHVPHLWSFASSAVLVCQAARAEGIELSGARFTMGGEPTTAARREAVRRMEAMPLPRYGSTETDILAFACRAPEDPDDMHFLDDRHALIQVPNGAGEAAPPAGALLVSSLLASAPVVLLNASLGDQARVSARACGCPLARLGWTTHVSTVRSFEKLTAGGVTLIDTDVLRVLEEELPARFGGAPTDYQLVEEEDAVGAPCVRLLVHPRIGELDSQAVSDAFLGALGEGSGGERLMMLQWRAAGVLVVERAVPLATASGKILHLHAVRTRDSCRRHM